MKPGNTKRVANCARGPLHSRRAAKIIVIGTSSLLRWSAFPVFAGHPRLLLLVTTLWSPASVARITHAWRLTRPKADITLSACGLVSTPPNQRLCASCFAVAKRYASMRKRVRRRGAGRMPLRASARCCPARELLFYLSSLRGNIHAAYLVTRATMREVVDIVPVLQHDAALWIRSCLRSHSTCFSGGRAGSAYP